MLHHSNPLFYLISFYRAFFKLFFLFSSTFLLYPILFFWIVFGRVSKNGLMGKEWGLQGKSVILAIRGYVSVSGGVAFKLLPPTLSK